ncbi:hypothetical protein ANN_13121 [Periplaneta americana]|uniref:Reverse transcriptase domain-containing protein n=1 Tax=Periplaneta americana TaxID=6978 RepID=A0ABQ8TIM7_PERAM|nr:hypothetical protein ANN_13121 [Periplaneta americana]
METDDCNSHEPRTDIIIDVCGREWSISLTEQPQNYHCRNSYSATRRPLAADTVSLETTDAFLANSNYNNIASERDECDNTSEKSLGSNAESYPAFARKKSQPNNLYQSEFEPEPARSTVSYANRYYTTDELEGMVNGRKVRGRRRYQMIDNIKIYGSYAETKRKAEDRKDPLQSGFRNGHSTSTALLNVTEDIRAAMDKRQATVLVLLDYSKAFDSVDFDLLLTKLQTLHLSDSAITWMYSYLTGCQKRVISSNRFSSRRMKDDDVNWNYNVTECEQQFFLFSEFPDYIITDYFRRNVINLVNKFRATECTERKKSVRWPTKVTEDAVEYARERMQRGRNKSVKKLAVEIGHSTSFTALQGPTITILLNKNYYYYCCYYTVMSKTATACNTPYASYNIFAMVRTSTVNATNLSTRNSYIESTEDKWSGNSIDLLTTLPGDNAGDMSPGSSTESYSYWVEGKSRKKPQPGNLPRPGFEPGPPGFAARRADRYSTGVDSAVDVVQRYGLGISESNSESSGPRFDSRSGRVAWVWFFRGFPLTPTDEYQSERGAGQKHLLLKCQHAVFHSGDPVSIPTSSYNLATEQCVMRIEMGVDSIMGTILVRKIKFLDHIMKKEDSAIEKKCSQFLRDTNLKSNWLEDIKNKRTQHLTDLDVPAVPPNPVKSRKENDVRSLYIFLSEKQKTYVTLN